MAVDYLSAMGAGAGLNTTEIVDALVEAERAPQQTIIDRTKERSEATISAYGLIKSAIGALKSAFAELDDVSDVKKMAAASDSPGSVIGIPNEDAIAGSFDITVTQLAKRDSWTFQGFDSLGEVLNSGSSFDVTLTKGGQPSTVAVTTATPQGIVDAINGADLGITASIIDTGSASNRYVIALTGELGLENAFTVSDSANSLQVPIQQSVAQDSLIEVNGVQVSRSSNTVSDAITGVTLNLLEENSTATIEVSPSITEVKAKIENLVATFNDFKTVINTLQRGEDPEDTLVGSLGSDSTLRMIINQIQSKMTAEISTPSGNINYLSDIGVGFNREGFLELNSTRLESALTNSFDDVVTALSADTEGQSEYGTASRGLAGDLSVLLGSYTKPLGAVTEVINNANSRLSEVEGKLADLEARMEQVRSRYLTQFTAMQQIVDQMNSTSDYLKSQFDALNNSN